MPEHAYYTINSPLVINETIEDESVIINLDNGFYYSLDNVGAEIWDALDKHIPVADICTGLAKKYTIETLFRKNNTVIWKYVNKIGEPGKNGTVINKHIIKL